MKINTAIEEICYDINDLSIHGLQTGNDSDRLVLCLHGWLDNAGSFLPLMPHFKDKNVIAIDWPGHGFSSHRSMDAHYHFIDWVYDLVLLFDVNQWTKVDIVAHSMGGMIATAFAAAFPDKVNSLTLIDSIGILANKAKNTTDQLREGLQSRLNASIRKNTKPLNLHPNIESAIAARVAVSDFTAEQAEYIVKRGLVKQGQGYRWRSDSRLRLISPYRLTLAQAKQLIKDVACPVNLIYGDKGLDMVKTGISDFSKEFQQIKMHELSGGHHLHMESPQEIAKIIEAFLQENPR